MVLKNSLTDRITKYNIGKTDELLLIFMQEFIISMHLWDFFTKIKH